MPIKIEKGQTLFEIVALIAVIGLVIIGLVKGLSLSLKNIQITKERGLAESYTQEAAEWLIYQRDLDWSNLHLGAYCLNNLDWLTPGDDQPENCSGYILDYNGVETGYKRNAVLTEITAGQEIQIIVNIYWNSPRGGETFSLTLNLTKWK